MRVFAVGILVLALTGSVAFAESAADLDQAQALVKEGAGFYAKHQYTEALQRFNAAYALYPSAKILYDVAQVMDSVGSHSDSANAYYRFLKAEQDDPAMASSKQVEQARQRLADLELTLGRLDLTLDPVAARATVDHVGATEPRVYVVPGAHEVSAEAEGYVAASQIVSVAAGQSTRVAIHLAKPNLVAAVVEVPQPTPPLTVPSTLAPQVTQPAPTGSSLRTGPAIVLGVAGALLVGALAMTAVTAHAYGNLPTSSAGAPSSYSGRYATELTDARVADGLWAAAIVAGGVGAGWWFFSAPAPSGALVGVRGSL